MSYTVLKNFNANGTDYEIRGWLIGDNVEGVIFIQAFEASTGKEANGYKYSVSIQDRVDAQTMKLPIDPFKSLIAIAENDVIDGTWESYQQTLK